MPRAKTGAMHVAKVVSRQGGREYVSYLLRHSYRDGAKVKHQTLANLSQLPPEAIELLRRFLAGERFSTVGEGLTVERSWPHGHVAAVLGTAQKLGLTGLLDPASSRERDLVLGMLLERILQPASKLATTRFWGTTSLGQRIGVEEVTENELYGAMDWLVERQEAIEGRLAQRHLKAGDRALYDLSSTYLEGSHCPLARRGYSRDGHPGSLQIEFGMLTNAAGDPVSVEVFPGNTGDPATFAAQVTKMRERFGIGEIIWVGDRGMITQAQIDGLREEGGQRWITALRAPAIRKLAEAEHIQMSLFDQQHLAELEVPEYPGERLIVCYNPLMAEERRRTREELLAATERELHKVVERVARGAAGGRAGLTGEAAIGERVGRVINKYHVAKHFRRAITDQSLTYQRDQARIDEEAKLDGIYVLRTNVQKEQLDGPEVVRAYKSLSQVERGFRHFKLTGLEVRPVYHYTERRVRAHLLLCMLAYLVQREMEKAWAPLLFADEAKLERPDPVTPALRSAQAQRKDRTLHTADGYQVHSFHTLLQDLGTIVKNRIAVQGADAQATFDRVTIPTKLQARAFELLGVPISAL